VLLSLAIVDELHAHRDAELYTALRTDARIVTITPAGSDDDSALGELRRRALELPEVTRDGTFTRAVMTDQDIRRLNAGEDGREGYYVKWLPGSVGPRALQYIVIDQFGQIERTPIFTAWDEAAMTKEQAVI
jgi:hypothetical protein